MSRIGCRSERLPGAGELRERSGRRCFADEAKFCSGRERSVRRQHGASSAAGGAGQGAEPEPGRQAAAQVGD